MGICSILGIFFFSTNRKKYFPNARTSGRGLKPQFGANNTLSVIAVICCTLIKINFSSTLIGYVWLKIFLYLRLTLVWAFYKYKLLVFISHAKTKAVLNSILTFRHNVCLTIICSCGLRLYKGTYLKVSDIDCKLMFQKIMPRIDRKCISSSVIFNWL